MPYIKQDDRTKFNQVLELVNGEALPENAGELNYLITKIVQISLANSKGNYQALNDAVGALEGAKLELYRRVVAPYEDLKINENGDV
jgi:hypothetical protein